MRFLQELINSGTVLDFKLTSEFDLVLSFAH